MLGAPAKTNGTHPYSNLNLLTVVCVVWCCWAAESSCCWNTTSGRRLMHRHKDNCNRNWTGIWNKVWPKKLRYYWLFNLFIYCLLLISHSEVVSSVLSIVYTVVFCLCLSVKKDSTPLLHLYLVELFFIIGFVYMYYYFSEKTPQLHDQRLIIIRLSFSQRKNTEAFARSRQCSPTPFKFM